MATSTTALLIIDVQNAILRGAGGRRAGEIQQALDGTVGRIAGLLARARAGGAPVIHVQHDGRPDHRLAVGSEGWQIRRELAPSNGEKVVRKQSCDAFFQTPLSAELAARAVDRLVVAGCMTEFCVDTTCRRAVSLGYDVDLVADGHMTADSGGLAFEQIIAHHNALLDGFDAGDHVIRVVPGGDIRF
jgi:nicotinamidase-related amidase